MKENLLKKGDFAEAGEESTSNTRNAANKGCQKASGKVRQGVNEGKGLAGRGTGGGNKVVCLNISQFELTKILYAGGILAECDLTPSAKLFLWALCSHYNPNNETMFPSQQTVAKKLGISEKSAQRAVKELKSFGLIDYETKRVNHYVFGEKFFELVKMSGMMGQNVLSDGGQNVRLTKNKEKKEEQKGFSSKSFAKRNAQNQGGNKALGGRMVPNVEETKKMIEENAKIREQSANPFEYDRKEALEWLQCMAPFWVKRSKVAAHLVEKYGFKEFEFVLKNNGNSKNLLENVGKPNIEPKKE